ncbi:MAG TPA: hypothetical protein DDW52_04290 [Planctomycetaceae bacterium]|nr:hypothetical protein [Planctomycetaceae bacterium]
MSNLLRRQLSASLIAFNVIVCVCNYSAAQSQNQIQLDNAQIKLLYPEIEVAAQADGIIKSVMVEEGAEIPSDQLAVSIDDRVAQAAVAVAKTELAAAKKTEAQTADIKFARATWDVAKQKLAEARYLVNQNAMGESALRDAQLEETRASLGVSVKIDEKEQQKMAVEVALEKLRAEEVKLEQYSIKSPTSGLVIERMRNKGEWVRAGEPVFKMVNLSEMKVVARVPIHSARPSRPPNPYGDEETVPVSKQNSKVTPSELKGAKVIIKVQVSSYEFSQESVVDYVSHRLIAGEVDVSARIQNQRLYPGGPWLLREDMIASIEIILP